MGGAADWKWAMNPWGELLVLAVPFVALGALIAYLIVAIGNGPRMRA